MSDYLVTDTELTSIADAIRTKGGTSASLSFPTEFVSAINAIETGGGGLEYEEGTFIPDADTNNVTINFTNTHEVAPIMIMIADSSGIDTNIFGPMCYWTYLDTYQAFGGAMGAGGGNSIRYGTSVYTYCSGGGSTTKQYFFHYPYTNGWASDWMYPKYWADNTRFMPARNSSSVNPNIKWLSSRTYKWIAIWK